jgi:hypothetical protein
MSFVIVSVKTEFDALNKKGDLYYYPIPFIVYGSMSTLSAALFAACIKETQGKKLPGLFFTFSISKFLNPK